MFKVVCRKEELNSLKYGMRDPIIYPTQKHNENVLRDV